MSSEEEPGDRKELSPPASGPREPVQNLGTLFLAAALALLLLLAAVGGVAYLAMSRH